jgi:hypothetical protein
VANELVLIVEDNPRNLKLLRDTRATDEIRVGYQHENRQDARPHDPAVSSGEGGSVIE